MEEKTTSLHHITYKSIATLLIAVAGFFCVGLYNKMDEVQKDIIQIKVQLVEVQSKMITRETVREIVQNEIYKYHRAYHPTMSLDNTQE